MHKIRVIKLKDADDVLDRIINVIHKGNANGDSAIAPNGWGYSPWSL